MQNPTDIQLRHAFAQDGAKLQDFLKPLMALAEESPTLAVGYGLGQAGVRESMIPYFHIVGPECELGRVRVLVVGGWTGTDTSTPLAVARLIAAVEARSPLAAGLEVTAYPLANVEAHNEGVFLTGEQSRQGVTCWAESGCSHIRVMENEMRRYPYDAVVLLRENPRSQGAEVEAWLHDEHQRQVVSATLRALADSDKAFRWKVNPIRPGYARTFTPIPDAAVQPAEILVGLPGARDPVGKSDEALGLLLTVLHAFREARAAASSAR